MAIQTRCPSCSAPYTLADTQAGKRVRCRKCTETFVVEATGAGVQGARARDAAPPAARRTAVAPRPAADRDDDRGPKCGGNPDVKKKGSAMPTVLIILGVVLVLLVMCGGGAVFGVYWWVRSSTQQFVDNVNDDINNPNNPNFPRPGNPNPFGDTRPFGEPHSPDNPSAEPANVDDAIDAWIGKTNDPSRHNRACDYLAKQVADPPHQPQVAATLEKLIKTDATREAAAKALGPWAGPENIPTLLREASRENSTAWKPCAAALVRLKAPKAAEAIAHHLGTGAWPEQKRDAADFLIDLGQPLAEKEVLKYANTQDPEGRKQAQRVLQSFGTGGAVLFDQMVADLRNGNNEAKKAACVSMQKAAVDEKRRSDAARALEVALGDDGDENLRNEAAKALLVWADKDSEGPLITAMGRDGNWIFDRGGWFAADVLVKHFKDERVAEAFAEQWLKPFRGGKVTARLKTLGSAVGQKVVVKYLHSENNEARGESEKLLKEWKTTNDVLFSQTAEDLASPNDNVKRAALDWLAKRPFEAASQAKIARGLDSLLTSNDFGLREASIKAVTVWADKDSIPAIAQEMNRDNGNNPKWAEFMEVLIKLNDEKGAMAIAVHLTHPDKNHRAKALEGIIKMGPASEKVFLNIILASPDANERMGACKFLAAHGTKENSLEKLQDVAKKDTSEKVKKEADAAAKAIMNR
jgi:predicted Zn finger-like uncharacterized protein